MNSISARKPSYWRFCLLTTLPLLLAMLLAACGGDGGPQPTPTLNRQGRIISADDGSNSVSLISTTTDQKVATVPTGARPHHIATTPDGREFWLTLNGESRVQVFDATTLEEVASIPLGTPGDDITMDPQGQRAYVSLNVKNAVAVLDVPGRKLLTLVRVGTAPHGVRVTPDGKYLLATNTTDNTMSLITLQPEIKAEATIATGANPYEIAISPDSKTAYVSEFLGGTMSVIDLTTRTATAHIVTGKQPAMLGLMESGDARVWVANTGSDEAWLVDVATRKPVAKVPVGKGAHGVQITPDGSKVYITSSKGNTVTAIDAVSGNVLNTIQVGAAPNGLAFLPDKK